MTKSLKLRVLSVALAGTVGLMAGTAKADVLATAVMQLSNLIFSHTGGAQLTTGDFVAGSIGYNNSGDISTAFTGFASGGGSGTGTPLNLPLACSGSCLGVTANGFQHLGPPTVGNGAVGDQNEIGFPIIGLGVPTAAVAESGAWSQIQAPSGAVGSATSNNGLTGTFIFAPVFTGTIDITSDFNFFWDVFMSAGEANTSFTQSRGTLDFNLVDITAGGIVFDFAPSALNWNFSINGPRGADLNLTNSGIGSFAFTTPTLFSGHTYLLTVSQVTLADVRRQATPEPGTLALLGLGLVGVFLGRRRITA